MTEKEAMEAAEEPMKVFDQIGRDCLEREQGTIETLAIDWHATGAERPPLI